MEELLAADFPDCDDESSSSSEDVLEDSSDQDQIDNNEETAPQNQECMTLAFSVAVSLLP